MKNLISLDNQDTIIQFCKHNNIIDYSINADGSIDVNGSVSLDFMSPNVTVLPIVFNSVSMNFACSDGGLTTMQGFPKIVGRDFLCNNNTIDSMEGGPHTVNGNYIFQYTDIKNLIGCAHTIGGNFSLYGNFHLTSLYALDDICIGGEITTDGISLPCEITTEDNDAQIKLILKYQRYFEIWNEDFTLNLTNYHVLLDEINDGLK